MAVKQSARTHKQANVALRNYDGEQLNMKHGAAPQHKCHRAELITAVQPNDSLIQRQAGKIGTDI